MAAPERVALRTVVREGAARATEAGPGSGSGLRNLPRGRPTIKVVAERAQVAISTVSHVLNGGVASDAARTRVQLAVRELGYAPSIAAQSLVTRRSGCVGLAVNSSQSPWFSQILAGLEESLAPSRNL